MSRNEQATTSERHINLPPPKSFDGEPSNWGKWTQRFDRYFFGSGLNEKSRKEQVSIFLYMLGEQIEDVLTVLNIDEETISYPDLKKKLDEYFSARKNIIVERAKFNKRIQKQGEPVETFIQDLHKLASECNFGTLKDELIRDRIVVGVLDDCLSEDLQSKPHLTLADAIQTSRQAEERKLCQPLIREGTSTADVHFVNKKAQFRKPHTQPGLHSSTNYRPKCGYCGKDQHSRDRCPAKNVICTFCRKRGHYRSVCRSDKRINALTDEVTADETNDPDYEGDTNVQFLGSIDQDLENQWTATITVNGHPTQFKLDTGASVSVIKSGESCLQGRPLQHSNKILRGPGGFTLSPLGSLQVTLSYHGRKTQETVYVLKDQPCSLLSRQACVTLGIVQRIDAVSDPIPSFSSSSVPLSPEKEFPGLFKGLGKLAKPYKISLRPEAHPVCIYTPRKVPHPLLPKVKEEIEDMQRKGVISPVEEPTDWCSGIVVVPKPSGAVRICVDLTQLNKAVQREIHPMASVDESLAKMAGSKLFTKLDAKSGFWQVPLCQESRLLTTFITPFGRFCFNRLPFGISSAPEIFQRSMTEILQDMEGVICHMDDILIHAPDQVVHDQRVRAVLKRLHEAGITLNEKCEFSRVSVKFLGHVIDANGIYADPNKIKAIKDFPAPMNVTELQRFMGMVNQLAKFIPNLAEVNAPLRELLRKNTVWIWSQHQELAFQRIKEMLVSPQVLAHYDPKKPTIIAADACNSGIGAVLLQIQEDESRRPVSYISRCLNDAEKNYAVIEKEALAATWACDRFSDYVLGLDFTLETDHKPLVPLLSTTELHKLPPRIQRFRLRMARYSPKVIHIQGKQQITADALSRAPVDEPDSADIDFLNQVSAMAGQTIEILPASTRRLQEIKEAQMSDEILLRVRDYCSRGWPAYLPENPLLKQYWLNRGHLTIVDNLLLFDDRLVIPKCMRIEILNCLHQSHLGITKCCELARCSVWWPLITSEIEEMVKRCHICNKLKPPIKEPLLSSSVPECPWSRVGVDLFELNGNTYVLVVDYLSRWIEIKLLSKTTSAETINNIKSIFATHGIPDVVISDNGPQFACHEFAEFASSYGFTHVTSSPRHPQSNGEAERAVQTMKQLLKKNMDPYLALLIYRTTPLQNGLSPAEILMSRKLRSIIPVLPSTLKPCIPDHESLQKKEALIKERQRLNFNKHHAARQSPPLQPGDSVFIRDLQRQGQVVQQHISPRSYLVRTERGNTVRRNRQALVATPSQSTEEHYPNHPLLAAAQATPPTRPLTPEINSAAQPSSLNTPVTAAASGPGVSGIRFTRSGRAVKPPTKLNL